MTSPQQPLKYYVYISDTKLDMLAASIPTNLRNSIIADLSLDLQVVKVSLRERPSEETRYSKLRLVTKYIDDKLDVGTVDEPQPFFRGSIPMRWGPYESYFAENDALVFFGSITDQTIVGLGGSMRHVIGAVGASSAGRTMSATPFILRALSQELGLDTSRMPDPATVKNPEAAALEDVARVVTDMPGPAEPLEFLARKLLAGSDRNSDRAVVLGTPIYVARSDD